MTQDDIISRRGELYREGEFWQFRFRDSMENIASPEEIARSSQPMGRAPIWVGGATGPKRLSRKEALDVVGAFLLSQLRRQAILQRSLTVLEFVERQFVPEFVGSKSIAGRIYYKSMLKHIVYPEEVERVFQVDGERRKGNLKSVADWPYIGHMPLCDVCPESVQSLTSSALRHGYSNRTVVQIRDVIRKIFDYAGKKMFFSGDNPVQRIQLPLVHPVSTLEPKSHMDISCLSSEAAIHFSSGSVEV